MLLERAQCDRSNGMGAPLLAQTLKDVVRRAYKQGFRGDDVWRYVRDGAVRSNKDVDAALGLIRKVGTQ